ncbi:Putative ribonuclease H protein At1g65750 [Linum perenne]
MGMSPPQSEQGEDLWVWGEEEKNGQFSIKSAYRIASRLECPKLEDPWLSVWRWKGPNRIRFFLWLAVQEKIMTNLGRMHRHLTTDSSCDACPGENETVLLVIRDCKFAAEVWNRIPDFDCNTAIWDKDFKTWSCFFLKSAHGTVFGITCWLIWKARNDRIFAGTSPNPLGVAIRSITWNKNVEEAKRREAFVMKSSSIGREIVRTAAATGGLLRDDQGRCLLAFTMNLGTCSITRAELRGAIEGLQRTWDGGYRKVQLFMDSMAAISLLKEVHHTSHQHGLEILQLRELCERDWMIRINHTYREGNHADDFLASTGYDYPLGSHTISISDSKLVYFLHYDCMGISEPRTILIND